MLLRQQVVARGARATVVNMVTRYAALRCCYMSQYRHFLIFYADICYAADGARRVIVIDAAAMLLLRGVTRYERCAILARYAPDIRWIAVMLPDRRAMLLLA